MTAPIQTDVAIIGAGTAGIGAFAELGKLGLSRVLINHGPLGTTCARVGCMPAKAVLHAGAQWATLRTLLNGAEPPAGANDGHVGLDGGGHGYLLFVYAQISKH